MEVDYEYMNKQIPHKIALIALLLLAFGVPFYFVRSQGSQLSYNDYIVSAGVVNGASVAPTTTPPKVSNSNSAATTAQISGSTFIGSNVK